MPPQKSLHIQECSFAGRQGQYGFSHTHLSIGYFPSSPTNRSALRFSTEYNIIFRTVDFLEGAETLPYNLWNSYVLKQKTT